MSAVALGRMAALGTLLCLVGTGCTLRYSQSISGEIRRVRMAEIQTADTGLEIYSLPFSEPKSANELLNIPCDAVVAVDYRALAYGPIAVPEIQAVSYCVAEEEEER